MARFLNYFKRLMIVVTVLLNTALAAAVLAQYINPKTIWIFSVAGWIFPILFLINFFLLGFWIIVRIKYSLLPLTILFISMPLVRDFVSFGFNKHKPEHAEPEGIRIMSYNVRNFDLYNWTNNERSRKGMISIIKDENPDIACFQEYYTQDTGFYNNTALLRTKAGFKYAHVEINYVLQKKQKWGIATFTNYPIINKGVVKFSTRTKNIAIYTDIVTPSDTFRVFNVHLQSYRLAQKDYNYIDSLQQGKPIDGESNKRIANKIKNAFIVRAEQVLTLTDYISKSPYKVILCGDFNDTPISYTYDQLTKNLSDAFIESGWGIGHTYISPIPLFRIDFILFDTAYRAYDYRCIHKNYSDHYPISTLLRKEK